MRNVFHKINICGKYLHHMIDAKKSTMTIDDNGTIMYSGCTLHQRPNYCPKHI